MQEHPEQTNELPPPTVITAPGAATVAAALGLIFGLADERLGSSEDPPRESQGSDAVD